MKLAAAHIEWVSIGDELLDGRTLDTNSVYAAKRLAVAGGQIAYKVAVPDNLQAIVQTVQGVVARGTQLCLITGGLGPTLDDPTAQGIAQAFNLPLVRDADTASTIAAKLKARGRPLSEAHLQQADRPAGAQLLHNPVGWAPGFILEQGGCRFVVMPGVPAEFKAMFEAAVMIPALALGEALPVALYRTFGLTESEVDAHLRPLQAAYPGVTVQLQIVFPEVWIRLWAQPAQGAALAACAAAIEAALGPAIFGRSEEESLPQRVVTALSARQETLTLAESCTGGLLAHLLTDVPGSSAAFELGLVSYSNAIKRQVGGVDVDSLAHGEAVSEPVAQAMAQQICALGKATWGLGVTGYLGPAGGSAQAPLGTVWLSVAHRDHGIVSTRRLQLHFDRERNKRSSAFAALAALYACLRAPALSKP